MLKNSKALMKVIKITDRLLFSIHDQEGVKLPLRLILKFSYLKKQKFSHKCKILWALCVGAYQKILSWSNLELFNSLYGIDIKKTNIRKILQLQFLFLLLWISIIATQIEKYFFIKLLVLKLLKYLVNQFYYHWC